MFTGLGLGGAACTASPGDEASPGDPNTTSPAPSVSIAFHGANGLAVIGADGTDLQPFSITAGHPHHPDWSPDGTQLTYQTEDDGDIWISDADGTDARRVFDCTSPCKIAEDPAWSPDGSQLAFWWNGPEGPYQWIDVVDIATGEVTQSIRGPALIGPVGPRWSPDGTRLVVAAGKFESNGSDYRYVDSAIGIIDLTDPSPSIEAITPDGMMATYPDWSPTGDRIVFQAGNGDPFTRSGTPPELYTVRPDGTDLKQITRYVPGDPWLALPDWTGLVEEPVLVALIGDGGRLTLGRIDMTTGGWSELLDATGQPIAGAHPRSSR